MLPFGFDAFRLLQNLLNVPKEEREAMFFGGLFSYDLVAGFENLPQLSAENSCPDFCFYLAETLMVIDHQKKHRIQASLFAPNEEEKQRLTARLNELRQQLTEAAPPLPVVSVPHMRCECNQSDEEFGGVVRLLQKRFAPEKFSRWCHLAVSLCPARHRWRPITC